MRSRNDIPTARPDTTTAGRSAHSDRLARPSHPRSIHARRRSLRRALPAFAVLGGLVLTACGGPVRSVHLRSDYEQADRTKTLRLAVVTSPLPADQQAVGELWSLIARRYVNMSRDFIARENLAAGVFPAGVCDDGIEGVLHLSPFVVQEGERVRQKLIANLLRCPGGETVWRAESEGVWSSEDKHLAEVTERYVETFGESVRPFVAPAFHILRATLDKLPRPALATEEDEMEKIELGE